MKIVNVIMVGKVQLPPDERLDLLRLARRMSNVEYRPRRFAPIIMRIKEPVRASALLYSSGSLICSGTRAAEDAVRACSTFLRKIRKVYPTANLNNCRVENMVASTQMEKGINLEQFSAHYWKKVSFHPELFPGAYMTPECHPKMKVAIFRSGKVTFVGARDMETLLEVLMELVDMLNNV